MLYTLNNIVASITVAAIVHEFPAVNQPSDVSSKFGLNNMKSSFGANAT